jgi:predicted alpha/beta hydrolase family esterase
MALADADRVLILPGWQNSGPAHWQSLWQARFGFVRVEQSDWDHPLRGDWLARLEDVVLSDDRPAVLVAHSLGCHLAACWAATSANRVRVRGALLVAPPDIERPDMPPQLSTWRVAARQRLPFAARVVYSSDDPYAAADRTRALAADWGASTTDMGPRGHLNAESGLGDWPQALAWLDELRAAR